ncbi:hypothetical protein [Micromonospora sp. NBC_01638]|uniref:hypothetical protein n=1 Tax=Micromonospora sp. NBC_01638 TaxID=2975982 RepID=UPI003864F299|nr:hypothetical protein OG811_11260 [Micromonospora sp. NBC_01638]
MHEPGDGPGTPALGRHRSAGGYRRVVGVHRALGAGGPSRGYLLTVALLAGTASMPILAAISVGSATPGSTALPDSSTPFIPTPSVGPVVIPLPVTSQPALPPRTPSVGPTSGWLPAAGRRTPGGPVAADQRPAQRVTYPPLAPKPTRGTSPAVPPPPPTDPGPGPTNPPDPTDPPDPDPTDPDPTDPGPTPTLTLDPTPTLDPTLGPTPTPTDASTATAVPTSTLSAPATTPGPTATPAAPTSGPSRAVPSPRPVAPTPTVGLAPPAGPTHSTVSPAVR